MFTWRPASEGGPYTRKKRRSEAPPVRGLEALVGGLGRGELQGDLVGDTDAVAFEGDDFLGVIRDHADVREAEVDQDLRADAAFVLDHALAGRFAIKLATRVKVDLRQGAGSFRRIDGEAATGMV